MCDPQPDAGWAAAIAEPRGHRQPQWVNWSVPSTYGVRMTCSGPGRSAAAPASIAVVAGLQAALLASFDADPVAAGAEKPRAAAARAPLPN